MSAFNGGAEPSAKSRKQSPNHRHLYNQSLLHQVTTATSLAHTFLSANDLLLLPSQTLTLESLLLSVSAAISPLISSPPPSPPPHRQCWFRRFLSSAAADWHHALRMSEHTFFSLLAELSPLLSAALPTVAADYALAAAVYRLAHGGGYKAVGRRFGLDSADACRAFFAVCKAVNVKFGCLFEFRSDYDRISGAFGRFSLPNCGGVLGFGRFGVAGELLGPNGCVLVQALVDCEGRFLDVSAGWPSTMTPEAIFRQSKLYLCVEESRELLNGPALELGGGISLPQYILGESCFPLLPWLLTPYVRSDEENSSGIGGLGEAFNYAHSRAMGLVGTAFARVRARWQLLNREWKEETVEFLPYVVVTGCLLHNFLIKCGEPAMMADESAGPPMEEELEELPVFDGQVNESGKRIRDALAKHLGQVSLRR